jgi:uncharacterized caspase-like protein
MKTLLLALSMMIITTSAMAQNGVALVIGNGSYGNEIGNLNKTVNDATDIAEKLKLSGFKVTKILNGNKRTMTAAIGKFSKSLSETGTVGLFYFAGHGVQADNRNYLIPVGALIGDESDLQYEAVDVGRVLGKMEDAGNKMNFVILDANRKNPFARYFRSARNGLGRIAVPKGTLIFNAASPGSVSQDGNGRNSIFTKNLLKKVNQPRLTVKKVFRQTAAAVYAETEKSQFPYLEGSIIGDFSFTSGQQSVASIAPKYSKRKKSLEHSLTVRSNVNGDTVTINGKNYGSTRLDLKLKHGEHTLKIEKEGFTTFTKKIFLGRDLLVRGILHEEAVVVTNKNENENSNKVLPRLLTVSLGKRVALVIGNSAYLHTASLPNPKNDANAFSKKLELKGFTVIKGIDQSKEQMLKSIRIFSKKLKGADVGLFFYAGHGMQVNGINYLVPVDAKLKSEEALDYEVIEADFVTKQLERQQRINLVFLDACRDNPLVGDLARSMGLTTRSISKSRGLAIAKRSNGTFIAYATQPGNVAVDGHGNHSPFTEGILKYIDQPGVDISILMRRVRSYVKTKTNNAQVPWDHSSLTGDFSFTPQK